MENFRRNKIEDTSYCHILSIEKVIFLIDRIRLYFHCHSYLVQASASEHKHNFWLPFQIVMMREKYFWRIIHLFVVFNLQYLQKIIWCSFCLAVRQLGYHVDVLNLHRIDLDKQKYTHLQR